MDEKCIRCGNPSVLPVRALEIRTLPVRGLSGERRVQALGDEITGGVCVSCAAEQLNRSLSPLRAAKNQLISFGAVFAAGPTIIAAAFLLLKGERVFLFLGIAALICGILGIVDAMKKAKDKSAALHALPASEALEEAAWDVFIAEAPKKEDMNDLTYIPVNEKTRSRKNGDLMILYNLLPEIAVQAWKHLHPENKEKGENK